MTEQEIEIQTRETRRVQLPYFAKLGTMYLWVTGKKVDGAPMGHGIYTDSSIILNTSCISDAFHINAVQITADEFWARWREAVAALQAMEGGAE
jgi:hypothetical protein